MDFTLESMVFPEATRRIRSLDTEAQDFIHYTTADAAFKIIRDKTFYLRNAAVMNDFSEIQYGRHCLMTALHSEQAGALFKQAVDGIEPGLHDELLNFLNWEIQNMLTQTYIGSFAAHHVVHDLLGRLSMWRAYGGRNGIGLVFHRHAFNQGGTIRPLILSPVTYSSPLSFQPHLREVAENIVRNLSFIRQLDIHFIKNTLKNSIRFAVNSTKHLGFAEEKEWRIIHQAIPNTSPGPIVELSTVLNGQPQIVRVVPLKDHGAFGGNLSMMNLLKGVVIGPTENPYQSMLAVRSLLFEAGFLDFQVDKMITSSDIPLRHPKS